MITNLRFGAATDNINTRCNLLPDSSLHRVVTSNKSHTSSPLTSQSTYSFIIYSNARPAVNNHNFPANILFANADNLYYYIRMNEKKHRNNLQNRRKKNYDSI